MPNSRGRHVIPFDHFINNDLEYLSGGVSSQKYATSVTKTKAADYRHIKWIEDLGRKRQQFYGFAANRESARDVYSKRRIIVVIKLEIVDWHNYKHLDWITVHRDDDKLYKFKEGDFNRLRIQDIEDMLLLLVQGKLTNLKVKERLAFNISLRIFTRSVVIQRRVEDLQLGVESYQKKLNLTKLDTYILDLKRREAYTAYSNPRGFIYQNKDKKNRLMRIDELHKFSDGTLNDVRTALNDHLKGIRIEISIDIWCKVTKDKAGEDNIIYSQLDDARHDRALLRARVNMLYRDRPFHRRTALLMEEEARVSRAAWVQSMDACDQTLLKADHGDRDSSEALKDSEEPQDQMIELQRQLGRVRILQSQAIRGGQKMFPKRLTKIEENKMKSEKKLPNNNKEQKAETRGRAYAARERQLQEGRPTVESNKNQEKWNECSKAYAVGVAGQNPDNIDSKCRSPVCWAEVEMFNSPVAEIVQNDTPEKFSVKQSLQRASDRQMSYADLKRKSMVFAVGDKVMLKVSLGKGVYVLAIQGNLNPRFVGTFHAVPLDGLYFDDKRQFVEVPERSKIVEVKRLRRSHIPFS
ncbi:hypothetical protein Tco_0278536 [Tanacetum coccineum]